MWENIFRFLVCSLFLVALVAEVQYVFTAQDRSGRIVSSEVEEDYDGEKTTYYEVEYRSPESGVMKREERFSPGIPGVFVFYIDQGTLRRGDVHPLRVPTAESWESSYKFGYWYSEFSKSLGLGLLAMLSLVMEVGDSRWGFWSK